MRSPGVLGLGSQASATPSPSASLGASPATGGQGSHASPNLSPSSLPWSALPTSGQLSLRSATPSPSRSIVVTASPGAAASRPVVSEGSTQVPATQVWPSGHAPLGEHGTSGAMTG